MCGYAFDCGATPLLKIKLRVEETLRCQGAGSGRKVQTCGMMVAKAPSIQPAASPRNCWAEQAAGAVE